MTENETNVTVAGVRTFDDVVVEWMKENPRTIRKVSDAMFGFDNAENITNESVERFIRAILNRGLHELAIEVEQMEGME